LKIGRSFMVHVHAWCKVHNYGYCRVSGFILQIESGTNLNPISLHPHILPPPSHIFCQFRITEQQQSNYIVKTANNSII
jgi:hypothetical protein